MAKAEVDMEMESMLETKNFEITRLADRVQHYEAVNRKISQRNQEAIGKRKPDYCFVISVSLGRMYLISNSVDTREAEEKEEAAMNMGINRSNHYTRKHGVGMVLHSCIQTIIRSITISQG